MKRRQFLKGLGFVAGACVLPNVSLASKVPASKFAIDKVLSDVALKHAPTGFISESIFPIVNNYEIEGIDQDGKVFKKIIEVGIKPVEVPTRIYRMKLLN